MAVAENQDLRRYCLDVAERANPSQGQKQRRVRRGETNEAVAQYQRQLARKGLRGPADQARAKYDNDEVLVWEFGNDDVSGWGIPVHPLSYAGAGLASLTVEFPLRGISFFFTTPRGDVTITARSVSHQLIQTMRRIGLALAAIAMAIVSYVAWLKWRGSWFSSRTWSTLAIVLGLIGAIIGILPILAVLVLIAAVAAKIDLRRRERAAA